MTSCGDVGMTRIFQSSWWGTTIVDSDGDQTRENCADVAIVTRQNWGGHFTTVTCKALRLSRWFFTNSFVQGRAPEAREHDAAVRNDAAVSARPCATTYRFGYS